METAHQPNQRRSKFLLFTVIAMMGRAILTFAVLIALSQTAVAGVPLFGHVSCAVVRFYVAKYSEATAEKWARSHGASDAEIQTARHCLHPSVDVQTASLAPKSQAVVPGAEQVSSQYKPDQSDPEPNAQRVSLEDQRADSEQDSHDEKPGVDGVIGAKEVEDHSTKRVSFETNNELAPSDAKTSITRRGNVDRMHHTYSAGATRHVSWLKRLWDHLTKRPQFHVALLHLGGGRR